MKKSPIVVIKLGTSSIVDETTHQPLLSTLSIIVETSVKLRKDGFRVVIVSSGAIGVALRQMNLPKRPKHLPQVQALAAIGQCRLIALWDQLFERLGQPIAQILLTRNDIADRTQYLNAQNTLSELLNMGIIPIVNENDTLSVSEIKFGDNDTLSAITAGMVQADYLFLMTDVDCLYDKNPRRYPDAKAIHVVEDISTLDVDISSPGSALGTGGMSTKIVAARLATAAGVTTIITRSSLPGNIGSIVRSIEAEKASKRNSASTPNGKSSPILSNSPVQKNLPIPLHTRFLPSLKPISDRHFWILHGHTPHGTIYIDGGAAHALGEKSGLLPVGIVDVEGHFAQQECVRLVEVRRRPGLPTRSPRTPPPQPSSPVGALSAPLAASALFPSATAPSSGVATPTSGTATPVSSVALSSSSTASPLWDPSQPPREIGRALVNYSAAELRRIKGVQSTEIAAVLGYADSEYVALRGNVALAGAAGLLAKGGGSRPATPVGRQTGAERGS